MLRTAGRSRSRKRLGVQLRGLELADSITFDPHKWMFVPFACGAVLVRGGGRILRDSFDMSPEYLNEDRGGADVEFDFFRYGQMGTRRFSSLKLWMALKLMGRAGLRRRDRTSGRTDKLPGPQDRPNGWLRTSRIGGDGSLLF